ncbi:MAG: sel1 repeat family protein [Clostridia bacterium]|nr:sel1 repeat family protein [Clostridia bacterium]
MNGQELFELAIKHIYGDGVPEDNDLAFKLLMQAHDLGHIEATYNLGICFHYGFGTSSDLGKAFALYLESAKAGYGKGMELTGRFYNRGIYVEQDSKAAEYWLTKAVESCDPDAVEEAKKELAFKEKCEQQENLL